MLKKLIRRRREQRLDRQIRQLYDSFSFHPDYERVYHYHIRKTGGTSINMAFLQTNGQEPARQLYERLGSQKPHQAVAGNRIFTGWNKKLIERGLYFFAFSHIPQHFLTLPPNTFTVTSLRDPVNRVISHYRMLRHYQVNNIDHPCMKTEGKWLGRSLNDFLDNMPKAHLLNQLFMFSGSYDVEQAAANIRKVNFLLRTYSLEEDLTELGKKLNLELEIFHEKQFEYEETYLDSTVARLREMLEPEYVLLGLLK